MSDLKSLVLAARVLEQAGEPFVVGTVVRVHGSSYRRPGARILLTRDRWVAGSVSGGCLENDLMAKAWWYTLSGPRLVTYDARTSNDLGWGLGVGCDGVVDVLLERPAADSIDPFTFVGRCFEAQDRGAIATVFAGQDARCGGHVAVAAGGTTLSDVDDKLLEEALAAECRVRIESGRTETVTLAHGQTTIEALVEVVRPPPRLFVIGSGHDAVPVVALARAIGWETIVCERQARFATEARFAEADAIVVGDERSLGTKIDACDRALAVIMTHDYARDRAALAMALGTRAMYIGVLGAKGRTGQMLEELGRASQGARLHAPVGLALGADSPQEIALAIIAEAQAVLTGETASSLRDRRGPIHPEMDRPSAAE